MKNFHNFQQTPPFNPPQMFYTTQRRRRRGQKIRHCFCMFCVCVWKKLCSKNSVPSNFSLLLLLQAVPFFDVHRCYCLNREALWIVHVLGQESTLEVFFILLFHNKYKFWNLGRNLLDFFSFLGKYNRRRMWFFVKGTRSRLGWPPGLLRWRWMTFTVCVFV